ncbi:uncharacterized protein MYCFIDRAFT_83717 [Pseudocercospora fijiensis CIRAD86]|uniref:Uncharacterized protein n=1 Tax=Pseudocercospora fijiensis (strain CIRAD86) TaxID=383855 RepID=M3A2Z3_PSEFD|nr:uncharacterized protein MYCFIDRAFT_83717 [Pseudocercospora fijiensis CIRAD86]EME78941.1 hypothetical protein MYCFIDRAFT_83717 [Pseudocercospora fijiensis CIRAD86]
MSQPIPPPTLHDLVQSLPQELYDEIYDLTFTPATKVAQVKISRKGKVKIPHLSLLQVNRATRARYISALTLTGEEAVTKKCVEKMPAALRRQLKDVRTFDHKGKPRHGVGRVCYRRQSLHYLEQELNEGVWKSFRFESQVSPRNSFRLL